MFGCVRILSPVSAAAEHIQFLDALSLSFRRILAPIQQGQDRCPLHKTSGRIAQESTPRLQGSVNSDVVLWRHVEVTRLWRMVRGLFRDIISSGPVREFPVAGEDFS